jgi:hypothetical protein
MTEEDWIASTNPIQLINHVCHDVGYLGRYPHYRKWRLFFCACCRRFWHLMADLRSRQAVEVSEQCAEGIAGEDPLVDACTAAAQVENELYRAYRSAAHGEQEQPLEWLAAGVAALAAEPELEMLQDILYKTWELVRVEAWRLGRPNRETAEEEEQAYQADLVRDVIGNPFRPVTLNPAWLAWNDGTNPKLAQAIYDERAFDRLPILADALEEAGCTDADILCHCRGPGPHVRACWVVDLILGKE